MRRRLSPRHLFPRRWLNGTTSGYMWLIFYPRLWSSCAACSSTGAMAFKIFFMSLLQASGAVFAWH